MKMKAYENELVYSIIARQRKIMGYSKNKTFMNEVLAFPRKNPNVYFMDKYTDKELNILPDIDIMLKENTLFGVFSALIPYEDREKAYHLLLKQNGDYYRYLHLPVSKPQFKYCPCCVKEQSEKYWNRTWFLPNLSVCPIHHCYLHNLDLKPFNGYYVAEEVIPKSSTIEECTDEKLLSLTDTIYKTSLFIPDTNFKLKNFLNLALTSYKKGCIVQIGKLYEDMTTKYNEFNKYKKSTLHDVILGRKWNFEVTCYLLDFLGVTLNIEEKQSFSSSLLYKDNDEIYRKVASELNLSTETVIQVVNSLRKFSVSPRKSMNYESLDEKYLKIIKNTCEQFLLEKKRVTYRGIQLALELPDQQLQKHLPKCKAVVDEYIMTNEQWRVQKLKYAYEDMIEDNVPFTMSNVLRYAGMKKAYLLSAYQEFRKEKGYDELRRLLENYTR